MNACVMNDAPKMFQVEMKFIIIPVNARGTIQTYFIHSNTRLNNGIKSKQTYPRLPTVVQSFCSYSMYFIART